MGRYRALHGFPSGLRRRTNAQRLVGLEPAATGLVQQVDQIDAIDVEYIEAVTVHFADQVNAAALHAEQRVILNKHLGDAKSLDLIQFSQYAVVGFDAELGDVASSAVFGLA